MTNSEFENICDRFDASWHSGNPLSIESLIADYANTDCDELLRALLEIEFECRIERGESPTVEEYSNRLPNRERILVDALSVARRRMEPSSQDLGASNVSELEHGIEPRDAIPGKIGRYKLLQKIGEGGMGTVYLAKQTEPISRQVALKVVKTDTATNEIIARFEAERQALALMEHHNIAKVLDAGVTENGRPYFIMELVNGIPITVYCDKNKLTPNERLELFVQTCRAIQHAHAKGIVHRDIKPSNVLVTLHDGKPTVKVIDFGLAKVIQDTHKLTERTLFTQHGQVVGTLAYMSPEQAEITTQDIDTRTDVYSLGVVFYELLTGSTPITAEKIRSEAFDRILALIREMEPVRPSARLSDSGDKITSISEERKTEPHRLSLILKGDLDWIAVKALEKNRDRRYETPGALADDVQRFLNGEAIEARPPSLGYQFQKSFRKHRARYIVAGTILVLLIAGLVGTGTMWLRASSAETLAINEAIFADEQRARAESLAVKEAQEREKAEAATKLADVQRKIAEKNAIKAESEAIKAERESQRARDGEASALFQLANARWSENRALEARQLLHQISPEYRNNFEWHFCNRHFLGSDVTLYGHSEQVNGVAFSPDGRRIASGSDDGRIKLWDARTGAKLRTLTGHTAIVSSVAFSHDGSQIASGSADNTIKLWDAHTGEELHTLKHSSAVRSLAFSPDGTRMLAGGSSAKLYHILSGIELISFGVEIGNVSSVAFSLDGTQIAAGSTNRTIEVRDALFGRERITLKGHHAWVSDVAFSPDGTKIASGSGDNTIKLWDIQTGEILKTFRGHIGLVNRVAFSPDGSRIASGGADTTIKLWDVQTGKEIWTLKGHAGPVNRVAFSPDGTRIGSGSADRTIKLWDARTGQHQIALKGHSNYISSVTFSPDGSKIGSGGADTTVKLWDAQTYEEVRTLTSHSAKVNSVAFSPDGARIASGGEDTTIRVWDIRTGEEIWTANYPEWLLCLAYSPDGMSIVSGWTDNLIKLVDANNGEGQILLKGHADYVPMPTFGAVFNEVPTVTYSPDGMLIASGGTDKTIRLWDANSGEEQITLTGHTDTVRSVAFSPDGTRVASGCDDGTIKLWDARTGQKLKTLSGHKRHVISVAFSPEGTKIVSGGSDRTMKLWDASTGKELITLKDHTPIYSLTFSPDGTRIATGGGGNAIKLWDAYRSSETTRLIGHSDLVDSVAFGPDGTRIASGSHDNTIKLWNIRTGEEQCTLKGHIHYVDSIAFSPDGKRIASGSWDKTVKLWDAHSGHELLSLKGHMNSVYSVDFSSDGTRIYTMSAGEFSSIQKIIWDSQTGQRITDEEWVEQTDKTKSPDGRWLVVPSSNEVLLVDLHFKNSPKERLYRQIKSRPNPWWHMEQANRAFNAEDWYAAAFHFGWLLHLNPESQNEADRFRTVWDHLDENVKNTLPYHPPTLNE